MTCTSTLGVDRSAADQWAHAWRNGASASRDRHTPGPASSTLDVSPATSEAQAGCRERCREECAVSGRSMTGNRESESHAGNRTLRKSLWCVLVRLSSSVTLDREYSVRSEASTVRTCATHDFQYGVSLASSDRWGLRSATLRVLHTGLHGELHGELHRHVWGRELAGAPM